MEFVFYFDLVLLMNIQDDEILENWLKEYFLILLKYKYTWYVGGVRVCMFEREKEREKIFPECLFLQRLWALSKYYLPGGGTKSEILLISQYFL